MTHIAAFILGAVCMAAVLVIADNWQYVRRGRNRDALPVIRDVHAKMEKLLTGK